MFIAIALALVVIWVVAFIAFHVAGFFIHILLIIALISLVLHFFQKK